MVQGIGARAVRLLLSMNIKGREVEPVLSLIAALGSAMSRSGDEYTKLLGGIEQAAKILEKWAAPGWT